MEARAVDGFMAELEHPLKREIEALRTIVLGSGEGITEHIKWNAPSFCYQGEDRVTFKLYPPNRVQLVFHRGAKKQDSASFTFADDSGLLEWVAKDRAVATFRNMQDVETKRAALARVVGAWMKSAG